MECLVDQFLSANFLISMHAVSAIAKNLHVGQIHEFFIRLECFSEFLRWRFDDCFLNIVYQLLNGVNLAQGKIGDMVAADLGKAFEKLMES